MELTEEQRALREAVRACAARYPTRPAALSPDGYDRRLWARLCAEIGVAGLAVPQRYGGAGATLLETHVVLEELGRTLTPTPLLGSAVLATQALLLAGDDDACTRLLPGLCAGTRIAAVAWVGAAGGWEPHEVACTATGDGRLTGVAHHVVDGAAADELLVAARAPDGIGLYAVAASTAGVTVTPADGLDLTRRLAAVRLDAVPARRLGTGTPLPRLRDLACVALSAEQVGAAARALELTVAYCRTRVQFGRPIGSFQALQHRLADLHVRVAGARSASYAAAAALVADDADASTLAAVAAVCCAEAFTAMAAEMIQLHGGLGITWEHDAHLYLRRAYASEHLFGAPRGHVARLADTVLARPC